MHGHIPSI
ncbi:hypothetical protein Zm00014a_021385 [Zea mays]|uniref:Uncharacterized protein n=1 Tax=Zea mays TaxID=4577 RepID=A0A3L6EM51_MAIZE|nr:hypothetical protein Zm00014a_021385 [Zea mays]